MRQHRHFAKKILPALIMTLAGWGGLRAQLAYPTWPQPAPAPPYAPAIDPENGNTAVDLPVPGFVGPAGDGVAPYAGANLEQQVNPAFIEWAASVVEYSPANPKLINTEFLDANTALGPVTGNVFDVVSLGDLSATDIAAGVSPGSITLAFATPIADGPGPDFVAFGNAFGVRGKAGTQVFSKLAYVEVSSDGVNFARFPSVDLNPKPTQKPWSYMVSNPTLIFNLFGKAANGYGLSWGVPFDLAQLAQHPLVAAGLLDLQNVRYVRLVAVVGNGAYSYDSYGHPIYDPWPTTGSPGPEVQAIGVLNVAVNTTASSGAATSTSLGSGNSAQGVIKPLAALGNKARSSATGPTPPGVNSANGGGPGYVYPASSDPAAEANGGDSSADGGDAAPSTLGENLNANPAASPTLTATALLASGASPLSGLTPSATSPLAPLTSVADSVNGRNAGKSQTDASATQVAAANSGVGGNPRPEGADLSPANSETINPGWLALGAFSLMALSGWALRRRS